MPFDPVEDIPDIETKSVHIRTMDLAMKSVVNNARFALKATNLRRSSKDKDLVRLLRDHLSLYTTAHRSIRILLRYAYRNKDYPVISGYLCDYSHIAMRKMLIQSMAEFKHMQMAEKVKTIAKQQAERALFTSYAAIASACALVVVNVKNDHGAKAELREFWQGLAGTSLICKAYWNIYIKDTLH